MRKISDILSAFGSALDVCSREIQRGLECSHWLSDQLQLSVPARLPRKVPFMSFGVIARLAEMTIIKAKRAGLTHGGFRRALVQLRILAVSSLVITNSTLKERKAKKAEVITQNVN